MHKVYQGIYLGWNFWVVQYSFLSLPLEILKTPLLSLTRGPRLIHREGSGTPLQYFCLENPMDGGAW